MLQDAGLPEGVPPPSSSRWSELCIPIHSRSMSCFVCPTSRTSPAEGSSNSGGQQQRVRLALALAGDPARLVLDEPTAALDVAARRAFWERIGASVSEGRTVLFATHRLEEADEVADRVVVIVDGRVVAEGTPNEVKAAASGRSAVSFVADGVAVDVLRRLPGVEEAETGRGRLTLHTSDPDATVRALFERLAVVEDLKITRAGMEEAFRQLTRGGS
jgi:ABC-2 type transport system ATP-binding protein